MDRESAVSDHLIHAGAGTSLVLAYLGLIPGFLPLLALSVSLTAVLVVPLLALGVAGAAVMGPPYALGRLITRARRRRRREEPPPGQWPWTVGAPHAS